MFVKQTESLMIPNFSLSNQQANYALAVTFTMASLLLTAISWPVVSDVPFLIPMAAVALSAWLGGLGPGMLSAALSIVSVDFFLIEPMYSVFTELTDVLQFGVFGLVALIIGWLEENRQQSAQSVRDLRDELETILNTVSDGITAQTLHGRVLFANSATAEMLGYESSQAILEIGPEERRRRYELFDQFGNPLPSDALPRNQVFSAGRSASLTFKNRLLETGVEKWLHLTSSPVFDEDGSVRLAVNVIRDVTEQYDAQLDRERLAAVVNNSDDAIISKDLNAVITTWNPGAERLYGYTADEIVGQSIAILFPEDIKADELMLHKRILTGERVHSYETRRVHKDGHELIISLTISPIYNPQGKSIGFSTIGRDITARKLREDEIKLLNKIAAEQHRRLETIVSSIPGIVYVGSGDNDIGQQHMDFISPYAEKMLGYSLDEWKLHDVANFWKKVVHPDDWERALAEANQIYSSDSPGSVEFRCITKDGEIIHAESHNAVLKDENDNRIGTCGVVMDVTERVKSRERLLKLTQLTESQRQHLKNIVENVPGIVYDSTFDVEIGSYQVTFISDYTKTMLGYEPGEWIKDPYFFTKIIPEEDRMDALQKAAIAHENNEPATVQFRCIRADGSTIFVESFFRVHQYEDELKSYGVIMDVTDRKRREEQINSLNRQLRIQKRRLDNIIANVPGVVYEMEVDPHDHSQRISYLSPFAEKMLGYEMDEMLVVPNIFRQVVHPDDAHNLSLLNFQDSDETRTCQYRCLTKDNRVVYVESFDRLVYDNSQKPVGAVGVVMDITQRKQIEDALDKYMLEITRSNQDLEQFAYVASHDLQEPLRKISSYLQLIEHRYSDKLDEDGKEFIGFAVDGATRMKRLINDLLTYSRVQRSKEEFQPVQLQQVIATVLENLELPIEESGAEITYDELPEVFGSKSQMVQLFQNLISNAIKFCGENLPHVHIGVEKAGSQWQFWVKDNGIGIDPKYFDRIFVIFQRLHSRREYSGTGIGLAICKKIIENHDGHIWVESEAGKGTTFYFTLPDQVKDMR